MLAKSVTKKTLIYSHCSVGYLLMVLSTKLRLYFIIHF